MTGTTETTTTTTMRRRGMVALVSGMAMALVLAACGSSVPMSDASATGSSATGSSASSGKVAVVAAENEYGNVVSQIGGRYVSVYSVDSNPNTDPHTFEATPAVAQQIAGAKLLIENGVGYDSFMTRLASASPSSARKIVDVQHLLGLPDSTPNPHLWYDPKTMPVVARAIAASLSALDPANKAMFEANSATFVASLQPWLDAIAAFKAKYGGTKAATTEPVADYLLQAMGIDNVTPFSFQADIMNGTDPSPQGMTAENRLFTKHQVKVFCYNQQVADTLTTSIRQTARKAGVPVVGVYETMPTPGYDYQSWMVAEVAAIRKAVVGGTSTQQL
ncbi:MAG: metal ABC transporter solute-binding protein, Zn/Mn family [Acidimicrobiales bacterium]